MANPEFKIFRGVGAVIVRVKNHTQFFVQTIVTTTEKVEFAEANRDLEVDLMLTPNHAAQWSDIRFDDRGVDKAGNELSANLNALSLRFGITSLGSGQLQDLPRSGFVGAVYIEDQHYRAIYGTKIALPSDPKPWPPPDRSLYEFTSVAYSKNDPAEPRHGRRYHAFSARVIDVAGSFIKLEFPRKPPSTPLGPWWFNLDAVNECDKDPPAAALDGAKSILDTPIIVGNTGVFFVELSHAVTLGLADPKLPIGFAG